MVYSEMQGRENTSQDLMALQYDSRNTNLPEQTLTPVQTTAIGQPYR